MMKKNKINRYEIKFLVTYQSKSTKEKREYFNTDYIKCSSKDLGRRITDFRETMLSLAKNNFINDEEYFVDIISINDIDCLDNNMII